MDRPIGLISQPFWKTATVVQTRWNLSTVGGILVALVLLTFIGWLYLDQAAMIADAEAQISLLEERRGYLLREYRSLQSHLAAAQSTDRVVAHAGAMGLHATGEIDTLDVPLLAPDIDVAIGEVSGEDHELDGLQAGAAPWLASFVGWLEVWFVPQPAEVQ